MPLSNGLLPPLLEASTSAFLTSETKVIIPFSIPKAMDQKIVRSIGIKISRLTDNQSIVNTNTWPDGIIYRFNNKCQSSEIKRGDILRKDAAFFFPAQDLIKEEWTAGSYFKVQMRFGQAEYSWTHSQQDPKYKTFEKWKNYQVTEGRFSEWSTVMIIKVIAQPQISMANAIINQGSTTGTIYFEQSLTPLFIGCVEDKGKSNNEKVALYRFSLYLGDELLETSGWLNHKNADILPDDMRYFNLLSDGEFGQIIEQSGSVDTYRFHRVLLDDTQYKVLYEIQTENGFNNIEDEYHGVDLKKEENSYYNFITQAQYLLKLENIKLVIDDASPECHEDGILNIKLQTLNNALLSGVYVLSRVSEKDNYTYAEAIKYFTFSAESFPEETTIFNDFTIESGVKYKYFFQKETSSMLRTAPLYELNASSLDMAPAHLIDFEYAYFDAEDLQIKLKYDNNLSSFKHTRLEAKQDTIGSKYPTIFKNSYADYAEFPITGLISLKSDEYEHFFRSQRGSESRGIYHKDELVIPSYKYESNVSSTNYQRDYRIYKKDKDNPEISVPDLTTPYVKGGGATGWVNSFNNNLTDNNIFMERIFREKVEQFLLNTDYKLFRSPTEGNIIVSLINVSLTPKQELGRMIYSFSATAYETLEYNMANLSNYGILSVDEPDWSEIDSEGTGDTFHFVGQISGLFRGAESDEDMPDFFSEGDNATKYASFIAKDTDDLKQLITDQIEKTVSGSTIGEEWRYELDKITGIWVEQYPKIDLDLKINKVAAHLADLLSIATPTEEEEEEIAETEETLNELELLRDFLKVQPAFPRVALNIGIDDGGNDNAITNLGINRFYSLEDINLTKLNLAYSGAVLINYKADAILVESKEKRVTSVSNVTSRGQLAGVFTETKEYLDTYDYLRDKTKLEVFELNRYRMGGLYQTKNILSMIKEDTLKNLYHVSPSIGEDGLTEYVSQTGEWTNGTYYYRFGDLKSISIEADKQTEIRITYAPNNYENIHIIGPTELYTVNPAKERITSISFVEPTFAIINYECEGIITTKESV